MKSVRSRKPDYLSLGRVTHARPVNMEVFVSQECVVCLDAAPQCVFSPCGHQCCCRDCGDAVRASPLGCPLCRAGILDLQESSGGAPIPAPLLESFRARRAEYVSRLPGLRLKAGFMGKSKLARSVNRAMCSELELRERERAGTDRLGAKAVEMRAEGDALHISYKVGRRLLKEQHACVEWTEAEAALLRELDGEVMATVLELATHYPEFYWLARHHHGADLEDVLSRAGAISGGKRRRRV